jgi:hypothetical protein
MIAKWHVTQGKMLGISPIFSEKIGEKDSQAHSGFPLLRNA